ncbi:MAG: ATP synthase F1 subunit gamma [Ignavibacteriaceae bacterium]
MATLRDIKGRIKGVQSTQKITKAMKMVAAAKLRRAQEAIVNARPYARQIFELLSHLATEDDLANNPYLQNKEVKNIAIVVVTADRGLCGAFNANIIKEATRYVNEDLGENVKAQIFCVGRKGFDFFSKRDFNIAGKKTGIFSTLRYDYSLEISEEVIGGFLNDSFQKVIIIYNEFKSIIQQKIVVEQFLPVPIKTSDENKSNPATSPNYIFEPDQKYIFNYLLPKHLKAQMWRILLESNASEFGAQMTAMDNATTNAKELIRTLQLKYNKERQAAITKEILEIVSGANALKGD